MNNQDTARVEGALGRWIVGAIAVILAAIAWGIAS